MNYFSDALAVGIVLMFVFGAVVFYLYTRIQQSEQKVGVLEVILIDLKAAADIKTYSSLPADVDVPEAIPSANSVPSSSPNHVENTPTEIVYDQFEEHSEEHDTEPVVEYLPMTDEPVLSVEQEQEHSQEHNDYESMNLKQLQGIAKSRGMTGIASLKKNALIDALKHYSVAASDLSSSSLIENSVPVVEEHHV